MFLERIEELIKEHSIGAPRTMFETSDIASRYVLFKIEEEVEELLKLLSKEIVDTREKIGDSNHRSNMYRSCNVKDIKILIAEKLIRVYNDEIIYKIKRQASILWDWYLDKIEIKTVSFMTEMSNKFIIVLIDHHDKSVYGKIHIDATGDKEDVAVSHFSKLDKETFDRLLGKGHLIIKRLKVINK